MKTTQNIIASLPEFCYGVLAGMNTLIRIKAGESGYYSANQVTPRIPKSTTRTAR